MKPQFDVVLIARNEEKTLPRLVGSLKEFKERGGEIWLLDTGSTDSTAQVARGLGCFVHEVGTKFMITLDKEKADAINSRFVVGGEEPLVKEGDKNFDYASARNYIAEFSHNDMIATPDCDEIYTALDIDRINKEIESGAEQFEYQFVFAHDQDGKPIIQFMHSKFYNKKKLKWAGIIHEVLVGDAKRKYLDESVVKLEHWQNPETNRSHYLTGLAIDCFTHPENDRNSHYFAREMMYKSRFKSAIKEFERHIAMNCWPTERSQSMIFVGDCHYYLGNIDETFKWYVKAFELEPNRREPLMKLAEHFYRVAKPQQAISFAVAALELPGVSYYANHQPYYEAIPHEILYWAYWQLGNKEKSREHWERALAFSPHNPKYQSDRQYYTGLQFTGERVVPDKMVERPDILREHLARYAWAQQFTAGQNVLDAACGTGYGKKILDAKAYLGLDNSEEAISYAREKYGDTFGLANLEDGVPVDLFYNVVVSFETIEHLENPDLFLNWVAKHADTFVFSIPINMPSEFHKQVYSIEQIKNLLKKYFPAFKLYGQVDNQIGELTKDSKYVVGYAIPKLPSLSVIIPTLGREEGLKRCLASIKYPGDITTHVIEGDETVPVKVAKGLVESTGDYLVYAANDVEFEPSTLLNAVVESIALRKGLVSFNEGELLPDNGNICTHFLIKRTLVEEIGGEIFDTEFHHVCCDNLLWAKCQKLGQAHYSIDSKIKHHHFSKTDSRVMDPVYQKGWSHVEEDRALLAKKLKEL